MDTMATRIQLREAYVAPENLESPVFKGVNFTDKNIQVASGMYLAINFSLEELWDSEYNLLKG